MGRRKIFLALQFVFGGISAVLCEEETFSLVIFCLIFATLYLQCLNSLYGVGVSAFVCVLVSRGALLQRCSFGGHVLVFLNASSQPVSP